MSPDIPTTPHNNCQKWILHLHLGSTWNCAKHIKRSCSELCKWSTATPTNQNEPALKREQIKAYFALVQIILQSKRNLLSDRYKQCGCFSHFPTETKLKITEAELTSAVSANKIKKIFFGVGWWKSGCGNQQYLRRMTQKASNDFALFLKTESTCRFTPVTKYTVHTRHNPWPQYEFMETLRSSTQV